jgi:hypothetical protein
LVHPSDSGSSSWSFSFYFCVAFSVRSGLGSILGTVRIFNKEFHPEARRDGGAEPPLNPNFLRIAYDVKACVLFMEIRPLNSDVMPGGHIGDFEKIRLIPAPGFPFILH